MFNYFSKKYYLCTQHSKNDRTKFKKMKVLLINGSPRENGNTMLALNEVAKTLNGEGIATEIISIGKQAVQGCIACGMCGRNGARCTFRDDL